jgi:hypothetical protein
MACLELLKNLGEFEAIRMTFCKTSHESAILIKFHKIFQNFVNICENHTQETISFQWNLANPLENTWNLDKSSKFSLNFPHNPQKHLKTSSRVLDSPREKCFPIRYLQNA